jgi:hypothetical protein
MYDRPKIRRATFFQEISQMAPMTATLRKRHHPNSIDPEPAVAHADEALSFILFCGCCFNLLCHPFDANDELDDAAI